MQAKKVLLVSSLMGILLVLLLAQAIPPLPLEKIQKTGNNDKIFASGIIKSTSYRQKYISIYLKGIDNEFVVFDTYIPGLKPDEPVKITGRTELWQNKTQILVDKIVLLK